MEILLTTVLRGQIFSFLVEGCDLKADCPKRCENPLEFLSTWGTKPTCSVLGKLNAPLLRLTTQAGSEGFLLFLCLLALFDVTNFPIHQRTLWLVSRLRGRDNVEGSQISGLFLGVRIWLESETVEPGSGSTHEKNDFVTVANICDTDNRALFLYRRVAVISAKKHKRQSVTAKREKSQTPKVLTAILTLPNVT